MTERPIPFSAPMVRAVLAGTKTQTRRVVKPQPRRVDGGVPFGDGPAWAHAEPGSAMIRCLYGKRGDRLWVREAWRAMAEHNNDRPLDIPWRAPIVYEASRHPDTAFGKLRPGMFMPRWASRITLEVTGVRVERLQDISEADAIAEGIELMPGPESYPMWKVYGREDTRISCPVESYRSLWESINGPESWDANPWVWVVEFRRSSNESTRA